MLIQIPDIPATLLRRLNEAGFEAFVVGGCVRDSLMGIQPHDWDICTDAKPEQVIQNLPDLPVLKTGLQHGTVTVIDGGKPFEITTFRTDGAYSDHRHPDHVEYVTSLKEDLARRDFTINAMAYHPAHGLIDYFGGRSDLSAGLIRCVGNPRLRFEEDGLRLMRALRFASRFGFQIEGETASSIHQCRFLLNEIAVERIFVELKGFLVGKEVEPLLLEYRDVLAQILPPLEKMFDFQQNNPHHCYDVWRHTARAVEMIRPDELLRLTMLFHDCGKPECWSRDEWGIDHFYDHAKQSVALTQEMLNHLRCDNDTKSQILHQVRWHDLPLPQTPREGRRFLRRMGEEGASLSLEIHRADAMAQSPDYLEEKLERIQSAQNILQQLVEENACFSLRKLAVSGHDLIELGYQPGPDLGRELNRLLDLVVEGQCPNQRHALLEQAKRKKE